MSRVSDGQRAKAAVAMGVAARKTDESAQAYFSRNPFRNYNRSLARSWAYGYEWAWLEREAPIPITVWKPGYAFHRRKPVEEKVQEAA